MHEEAMKTIKIHFTDFSSNVTLEKNYIFQVLSRKYQLDTKSDNPDYVVFSDFGYEHLNYNCIRIYITGENLRPDFNIADYALGFDYIDFEDRYIRFPLYAHWREQLNNLVRNRSFDESVFVQKKRFCNFLVSHPEDPARDDFFNLLSSYKRVDSPGKHLNNMEQLAGDRNGSNWRTTKIEFQKSYKFTIAYENSSTSGYTTEKLMDALIADTIPIYWGNPRIAEEFDPQSFINCHDYKDCNAVIDRIIELDNDDARYLQMLNAHCLYGNSIPFVLSEEYLLRFFDNIFSQPLCNAFRRPLCGWTAIMEGRRRECVQILRYGTPLLRIIRKIRAVTKL